MMGTIDFDSEERDEKSIKTSIGCVNAINRIIESIGTQEKLRNKDEILQSIQADLFNMLSTSLDIRFDESHELIITTISLLTGFSSGINENMWGHFPNLVNLFNHYLNVNGQYYILDPIVLSMCNFIQKGQDVFVNSKMQNDQTPLECLF